MNDRITESDLLALIEGELPADRRAIVGEALRTDPVLRRRVEAMIRDAQVLGEDRVSPPSAPHGVIARAMDEAWAPVASIGPRRRRFAMAAIITVAMMGVWGVILYATFGPSGSSNDVAERPKRSVIVPDELQPMLEQLAALEEEYFNPPLDLTEGQGPLLSDATPGYDEEPSEFDTLAEVEIDPEMESMLDAFVESAKRAEEARFAGAAALVAMLEGQKDGPAIAAVARAATEGRLTIVAADGLPEIGGPVLASTDAGEGWRMQASALTGDDHDFVRDYAKPDPNGTGAPPVRQHDDDPRAIRVDLALVGETVESRERGAALALDRLVRQWNMAGGAAVSLRFVVHEAAIEGLKPRPVDDADAGEAWSSDLPDGAVITGVLIERASESDGDDPR